MAIDLKALREKQQKLEEQAARQSGEGFTNNFLKLEDGNTNVRILPGKEEDDPWYAETKIHRVPDGEDGVTNFHCLKVHGESCPLCDAYYKLWDLYNKTGKTETTYSETAKQIKPRERYYMNVVDRSIEDDSEESAVKILSVGQIIFRKIISTILAVDDDEESETYGQAEYGDITDLENGHDFKIVKKMEGKWPKYDESAVRPKSKPAATTKKKMAEYMDSLHDLQALVRKEEFDKVKAAALTLCPTLEIGRPVESGGRTEKDKREELQA